MSHGLHIGSHHIVSEWVNKCLYLLAEAQDETKIKGGPLIIKLLDSLTLVSDLVIDVMSKKLQYRNLPF